MNFENEICRKVYDHHTVLKAEISTLMLEEFSKAGVSRDVIASVANILSHAVDGSTNKMVNDFQKTFKKSK